MYLSILRATGIHRLIDGQWDICSPAARGNGKGSVRPALAHVVSILERKPDARVNVKAIIDELRRPPYGVRDGLAPLLLTAFALAHEEDVAFYKDGSFLREMSGEAMLVLTKAPERFDIQYCKIRIKARKFQRCK